MSVLDSRSVSQALTEIFRLEQQADELKAQILSAPVEVTIDALTRAVAEARAERDDVQRVMRLTSVVSILSHMQGPAVVDLLIDVLGDDEPTTRHAAGSVLCQAAHERFKEVALGIERAIERLAPESPALRELPYILMEVPEPGVAKLLTRLLLHSDAEVVASALEASLEVGDPSLVRTITTLEKDPRVVELEPDDEDEECCAECTCPETDEAHEGECCGHAHRHGGAHKPPQTPVVVTIGELAREARELLAPAPPPRERHASRHGGGQGSPNGVATQSGTPEHQRDRGGRKKR